MAPPTDPFQPYRDRLDPRVAADLGAWAAELGKMTLIEPDSTLERWAGTVSEADFETLRGLGERLSQWTAEDSSTAGFAVAAWGRLDPDGRANLVDRYRPVLGQRRIWEIEAQAAYRSGQLAAVGEETAMDWTADRWDEADTELRPAVLTEFDPAREAMERGARAVAARRELRSRELGITVGPRETAGDRDRGAEWEHPEPDDPLAYPVSPVADPEEAVARSRGALGDLGTRRFGVEIDAETIVDSFGASGPEALEALEAELAAEMPAAAAAANGRIEVPRGVRESMRIEHVQRVAAQKRIDAMEIAGELRWGSGPAPGAEARREMHRHALDAAAHHGQVVDRFEAALDSRRAQGADAGTWHASDARDHLTRGFAVGVVRDDMERRQRREVAADLGFGL